MSDIKIDADAKSREMFGITEDTVTPSTAQTLVDRVNSSQQGEATVKDGKLEIRRLIRD